MSILRKYQFPIVFGSLLSMALVGFSFRERFLPDIEVEREKIYNEDQETKLFLQNQIAALRQAK